jgi:EAL domain-containing protein (putative c-di-GMP-specific phosphodiesterase class I)
MEQGIGDCKIAINLSSVQLTQPDIVYKILSTLEKYDVPPRLFEIEITETILMDNVQVAMESLQRLHSRGISIAIDDFGTGYSSLSYLKNLPVDRLKIDRAFIKDICRDVNDQKIVQTLITMAQSMDMLVVAEGVENKEQYDLLKQYSCDEIQGYLVSAPLSAEDLLELIETTGKQIENDANVVQLHS